MKAVNALIDLEPNEARDRYELLKACRPHELAKAMTSLANLRRIFGGKR